MSDCKGGSGENIRGSEWWIRLLNFGVEPSRVQDAPDILNN